MMILTTREALEVAGALATPGVFFVNHELGKGKVGVDRERQIV